MSTDTAAQAAAPTEASADSSQQTEQAEQTQQASGEEVSAEQAADIVEQAKAEGASKEEIKSLKKMFSLKVNGKTINKEFDFSDEKAMQKELQMAAAGHEALQMKAEYEKALKTLVTKLRNDPLALAEELGLDADELAAIRLQKRLEEAKKSPEQVEKEKLEREISEYRRREEERTKQMQEAEQSRVLDTAQKQIDEEIDKALEGYKTLPSGSPMVFDMIAKNMIWVMDNYEQFGYASPDDVKVEDVLPTVEQQLKGTINKLLEEVPEEFLDAWIGQKTVDKQRNKRLASAKKVNNINNISKTVAPKVEKKEERPKIKISDWMRDI